MTISFGFYNSINGDRAYDAVQMSEFFDGILNDGVLSGVGTAFTLRAEASSVVLGSGRAWFNKTWTVNDGDLSIPILAASSANPRIDSLVLEVDTRLEYRRNSVMFVPGTASAAPVPPVLSPPAGVYQYVLATILRPRDSTTVAQNQIVRTVGTAICPIATNAIADIDMADLLTHKRTTVRGNHLGSVLTSAQKTAIKNGSFEGLYLGDYWTYKGVNWRIVDFNYWLGKQQTATEKDERITKNHIVIMPDDTRALFANIKPFPTPRTVNNCGFWFSTTARNRATEVGTIAQGLFGSSGLLTRMALMPSTLSVQRYAMNVERVLVTGTPPTESQIIGTRNLAIGSASVDTQQFALFAMNERYLWMGHDRGQVGEIPAGRGIYYGAMWTMNQYIMENWTCMHDSIGATAHHPGSTAHGDEHQIRSAFGVTGG